MSRVALVLAGVFGPGACIGAASQVDAGVAADSGTNDGGAPFDDAGHVGGGVADAGLTDGGSDVVPSWVPAPGDIAYYTSNGAVLTNGFNDTVPSYYSTFYSGKIITDYSTVTANPYMGTHGGLVIRGGGHAATNYNATAGLVTSGNSIKFVQLNDPTNWFPATPTDNDQGRAGDAAHTDQAWGDALLSVDTQPRPAAPHSYAVGDIIPPGRGGGARGTYFEVIHAAPGAGGALSVPGSPSEFYGAPGSHSLPLMNDATTSGNVWQRAGSNPLSGNKNWGGPAASAFVSSQHRSYYAVRIAGTSMRWFDHATLEHKIGTGKSVLDGTASDPDSAAMFEVAPRNLLIGIDRSQGQMRLKYADTTSADPSARTATFSSPLWAGPADSGWSQAFYCDANGKIYIGNLLSSEAGAFDTSAIFEVTLPATLTDPWPVRRVVLPAGKVFPTGSDWQRFAWLPAARSALHLSHNFSTGTTTLMVWRPPGT